MYCLSWANHGVEGRGFNYGTSYAACEEKASFFGGRGGGSELVLGV